jgi:hypothetical protein
MATTPMPSRAARRSSRSSPRSSAGSASPPARPHPARFLRQLARVAAKHTTRDSTKYTRCVRSFRQYHGQRISHAIVMTDARPQHPRGDPEAQEDRCCCSAARPTRAAPMWRPSPAWGVDCLYQFTSYMREGYTRHAVRTNLTEAVSRINMLPEEALRWRNDDLRRREGCC